jgi:hypothetical protein
MIMGVFANVAPHILLVEAEEKRNMDSNYPFVDGDGYTWYSEDSYDDDVGGHHWKNMGYNPYGVRCGECGKETCCDCINRYALPVEED